MADAISTQVQAAAALRGLYRVNGKIVGVIKDVIRLGDDDYVVVGWEDGEITLDNSVYHEEIYATREHALASIAANIEEAA